MQLHEVYVGLGEERLRELLRHISLGRLKTYQLFETLKTRARLAKLNQENLRKSSPRLWVRLQEGDSELASDLAQCILISHMDMIVAVLNHLGVPHNDGFFEKNADIAAHLSGDWQQRAFHQFRASYPEPVLTFYLNHLALEIHNSASVFVPAAE